MKHIILSICLAFFFLSCKNENNQLENVSYLRDIYSQPDASKWPEPHLDSLIDKTTFKDIGLLGEVEHPKDNPYSAEKKLLGKMLFFDARLSETGQIACASCHNPELAWTDNITRSLGHDRQNNKRNSMTIKNVAFAHTLFWDGRAESLEHQASFPISDPKEMNTENNVAVERIAAVEGYLPLFEDAFGDTEINLDRILKSIATFERSLVSRTSKFDRFIKGKKDAFTDQEVLGMHLFRTKARCINCHNTPYFSDNQFHNDGQALFGTKDEDFGRYYHTKNKEDLGKFKTPTLREVSKTGPWMHHGHFPSLLDVVEFYNLGNPAPIQKKYLGIGRDSLIPTTSPMLKRLDLTKDEINALIAFMETLSTNTQRVNLNLMPE
ncbi:cytochrome-c peroxidase [Winogradskyella schleiferi]|uniref:cytochrome-c peroxidase n=1 Tax=Winogradskyella schleiferi TaxID=2686078 RepID=UPI0015BF394E|nr:cytochrome c peroxidase [Winogradskyella schleiferi]